MLEFNKTYFRWNITDVKLNWNKTNDLHKLNSAGTTGRVAARAIAETIVVRTDIKFYLPNRPTQSICVDVATKK